MAVTSPRLDLRQGQSLVMTPQLQQSIKLLQLNNLELSEFVDQELAENPLLERDESSATGDAPDDIDGAVERADSDPLASDQALALSGDMPEGKDFADIDASNDDIWSSEEGGTIVPTPQLSAGHAQSQGGAGFSGPDGNSIEQTASSPGTLREHLLAQLGLELDDPSERLIGSHIVELVDDAGYLAGDLGAVATMLGCPTARVEQVLEKLQRFDPPGVLARDLAECLALQLRELDRFDPAMSALVANLDLVAAGDIAGLRRVCGVDDEDLVDMVAEVRRLNPKPGLAFDNELAQPVVPDVFVRPRPGGGWMVELNNDTLPRVMVNNHYYAELNSQTKGGEDRAFISSCMRNANWLVRSLDQRARTILKVASEVARQQEAFFLHGVQHLRPLTLRDVADAIEMHESTVSRVSSNKFVATPRGTYELRYFFSGSLGNSDGGEAHAAEAVKARIRKLIESEGPDTVLSDDRIADALTESGIEIARRTVAKYREAMRIPSSVQRRRQFTKAANGL